jgi:hypothetical protein
VTSFTVRGSLIALLLGVVSLGCSSHQRNEDFIPEEQRARQALESYLSAWQKGNFEQAVPDTKPVVMSGDSLHAAHRPLKEFTILGPVAADAHRCYAVRLVLDAPHEERRDRYVVIGIDPLWVMLYDDYEMVLHWDHSMMTTKKQPADTSRSSGK